MESRAFIKHAKVLIHKINTVDATTTTEHRGVIQKEVSQLFAGLQNPTLPSAYNLRDAALAKGFNVDSKVQHRLTQAETL